MTPSSLLLLVGLVYSFLYVLDTLAKSLCPYSYLRTLRALGIDVGILQFRWTTDRFNRSLTRISQISPRLMTVWFTVGSVLSSLLLIPCMLLLVITLINQVKILLKDYEKTVVPPSQEHDRIVLQPVIPGVNLPSTELTYYFLSLLLCSVYHEAGHALAALNVNMKINGCGVLLFFILPAAFVELPTEQLVSKPFLAQLKVFSAGIWHNLVLAGVAFIMVWCLPVLVFPLYQYKAGGLSVVEVDTGTSVSGAGGLHHGDVLTSIQGRELDGLGKYKIVIASLLNEPQTGICVDHELIGELQVKGGEDSDCCPSSLNSHNCFKQNNSSVCLPVRLLIEKSKHVKPSDTGAKRELLGVGDRMSASNSTPISKVIHCTKSCEFSSHACAIPHFSDNRTRLVIVDRANDKEFLFIGSPTEIYQYTKLSEYVPRISISVLHGIPDYLAKLLNYIVSFSLGLAVLNVVPSYMLDGGHMTKALLGILMERKSSELRERVSSIMMITGTCLIFLNIVLGLVSIMI